MLNKSKYLLIIILLASSGFIFGLDKHQVSIDGLSFTNWESYLTSSYFKNANKKCLVKTLETNKNFKTASDCTKSLTNIKGEYYPSSYYIIPVVFHVIYASDGTGNIDNSFIYSQIDILNEDYGAMSGTPGDSGFDSHIKFTLAGITRTENDNWFNDNDESGYKSALGWDQGSYLNIYVNTASGYLGYSYMPQDAAGSTLDGVVVAYAAVGRNSPNGVYDQGRTLTHEIGHYLGLFHTFSPNEGSASGTCVNSYTAGDLIVDTNSEGDEHYGCSESASCGTQDPIHNYMDYTDDACMNNFTQEQSNRMICCLFSYRPSLYTEVSAGAPIISSFSSSTTNGLIPLSVTFNVSASDPDGGSITSYQWDFDGDGNADTTNTIGTASHTYSIEGTYYAKVTVTDDEGDSATSSAISINATGKVSPSITNFSATPSSGLEPLTVDFQVTAVDPDGGTITDYSFDFQSDGTIDQSGTSNTAIYQYTESGSYNAKVIVTDDEGQKSFSSVTITVNDVLPPVITNFSANKTSGIVPLSITFTVAATDPGGGNITSYQWDFDNDGTYDSTTTSGTVTKTFSSKGTYGVTVKVTDDDGDSVISNTLNIFASNPAPTFIPLTIPTNLKLSDAETETFFLNPNPSIATVTINALNNNGTILQTIFENVNPFQKFKIDTSKITTAFDKIKISADQRIIIYSNIKFNEGQMSAYLLQDLSKKLIVPHIAEEINDWESTSFISNNMSFLSKIDVNNTVTSLGNKMTYNLNLENFLTGEITEQNAWGSMSTTVTNPFQDSNSLNGFEMFVKNNSDGAAIELANTSSKVLYIPHIPTETDIFWTGFTFVNTSSSTSNLKFSFYSSKGDLIGTGLKIINAKEKLKGTFKQLFPEFAGIAEWGIVNSDMPLVGAEIYGTYNAGICGFLLPNNLKNNSFLPQLENDSNNWTGLAISNPSDSTAIVTISLFSEEGSSKGEVVVNIESYNKLSIVVSDLFPEITLSENDFIKIDSNIGIVAVEASGDLNRNWMTALTAQ